VLRRSFHADRWVEAFFAVSGENAEPIFLYLKIIAPRIKSIHGVFFGHGSSVKFEEILMDSVSSAGIKDTSLAAAEYAVRFVCLLIEKNCFRHIDILLSRIEQMLNERKGILDITVETAVPLAGGFEEEMARMIREKTGSAGVKLHTVIRPELIGGYLIRLGSFYIDASFKRQMENMMEDFTRAIKGRGVNDGEL
jgi:F-type H+-transporting ATPase subunit delta